MDTRGATTIIKAQVPMAEMLTYEQHLTSATGGRGSYHMEYSHYDEVPGAAADEDHRGGEGGTGGRGGRRGLRGNQAGRQRHEAREHVALIVSMEASRLRAFVAET